MEELDNALFDLIEWMTKDWKKKYPNGKLPDSIKNQVMMIGKDYRMMRLDGKV